MQIKIERDNPGAGVVVRLDGKMDTPAAGEFADEAERVLSGDALNLVIDLEHLAYICSAGLRVFLQIQKTVNARQGVDMTVINCPKVIQEIFEMTGFSGIIDVRS